MTGAPQASRPSMPGYGLPPAEAGTWPWDWAERILVAAMRYWLATTRVDGRPHLMPLWGVWHGGALWFSTGNRSVKAANLAVRPTCAVSVESGPHGVVVEGVAHRLPAPPPEVAAAYDAKYQMTLPPGEPVYRLVPVVAFGLSDAEGEFVRSTRWRFPAASAGTG
jgi:hypothetical protein